MRQNEQCHANQIEPRSYGQADLANQSIDLNSAYEREFANFSMIRRERVQRLHGLRRIPSRNGGERHYSKGRNHLKSRGVRGNTSLTSAGTTK
jgi:hypothetical protein